MIQDVEPRQSIPVTCYRRFMWRDRACYVTITHDRYEDGTTSEPRWVAMDAAGHILPGVEVESREFKERIKEFLA